MKTMEPAEAIGWLRAMAKTMQSVADAVEKVFVNEGPKPDLEKPFLHRPIVETSSSMTPAPRKVGRPRKVEFEQSRYPEPVTVPVRPKQEEGESNEGVLPASPKGIAIGRTLIDPWSPVDLQARLDGDRGRAFAWIAAWKQRGWLATVGFNQYRKTERFGQ